MPPKISNKLHIDWPLLTGIILVCLWGLVIIYSASDKNLDMMVRQLMRISLGFGIMLFIAQISPEHLYRISLNLFGGAIFMLLIVLALGVIGKGAQRWIDLGIMRFQPSELAKIAVPMMIAQYLSEQQLPPSNTLIFKALAMILIPVLLIAKQPDLGTALLVGSSGVFVLFLAGISWQMISIFAGSLIALAPIVWTMLHKYQKKRVLMLLFPESDPLGAGYHIIQSKIAIGSGGLHGKGWLHGTQSHLDFLPERHTDFIFAVLAEEFGLIGVIVLIGLYSFIIFRGLYIANQAQDTYGRLLSGSLTLVFFVYIFVNIGMVSGMLPVVGVPLPLISYGGTSLVTIMAAFGIIMSIHTHRKLLIA